MNIRKASLMKKGLVTGVAAVSMLVSIVGPAAAELPGAGAFVGFEYAPEANLIMPSLLCAKFLASPDEPLSIKVDMEGTFHGVPGSGTAEFKATTEYFANPEGTHSTANCLSPATVPGTVTINFGSQSCTALDATYQRRGTTAIEIQAPSCKTTFVGGQEPCPSDPPFLPVELGGCQIDPDASSIVEGAYANT